MFIILRRSHILSALILFSSAFISVHPSQAYNKIGHFINFSFRTLGTDLFFQMLLRAMTIFVILNRIEFIAPSLLPFYSIFIVIDESYNLRFSLTQIYTWHKYIHGNKGDYKIQHYSRFETTLKLIYFIGSRYIFC